TTSDENIDFKWLTDSLVTTEIEQQFLLPDATKYDFSLAAFSNLTTCSDTLFKNDLVEVYPKPDAEFTVDFPVAIIEHAHLQFTNLTSGVESYYWEFGDGGTSAEENPQHSYSELGKFPVNLIV